jgi:hypothetical protein
MNIYKNIKQVSTASFPESLPPIFWEPSKLEDFKKCLFPDTPVVNGDYFEVGWGLKIPAVVSYADSRLLRNVSIALPWPKGLPTLSPDNSNIWPPSACGSYIPCTGYKPHDNSLTNIPTLPFYKGAGIVVGCPKVKFSKEQQLYDYGGRGRGLIFGPSFDNWDENIRIKLKITGCLFMRFLLGVGKPYGRQPFSFCQSPNIGWRGCVLNYFSCTNNYTNIGEIEGMASLRSLNDRETLFESCPIRNVDTNITLKGPRLNKKYLRAADVNAQGFRHFDFINYYAVLMPEIFSARLFPTGSVGYYGEYEVTFENSPDVVIRGILSGDLNNKPQRNGWHWQNPYQDYSAGCACSGLSGSGLPSTSICPHYRNMNWCTTPYAGKIMGQNCSSPFSSSSSSSSSSVYPDITKLNLRWCLYEPAIFVSEDADLCTGFKLPCPSSSSCEPAPPPGRCLSAGWAGWSLGCYYQKDAAINPYLICCPKTNISGEITGYHEAESLRSLYDSRADKIYYYCPLTEQELYNKDYPRFYDRFWSGCCRQVPSSSSSNRMSAQMLEKFMSIFNNDEILKLLND